MTVYVDLPLWKRRKQWYCHMFTDQTDLTELHEMAKRGGIKRCWFENHAPGDHPHYDVSTVQRNNVLKLGAQFMSGKDWARMIQSRRKVNNETN